MIKEIYNNILNDEDIRNIYNSIHIYEDEEKGWAYHDFNHVLNVSSLVEQILIKLKYDEELIYSAKIASILHDVGAILGKDNHALRSYEYAINYFLEKNIDIKYKNEVLEAIKIHSDGFSTDNIIALSIILADKLDVKYTRVAEEGKTIEGHRQYLNIIDIKTEIDNNYLKIYFTTNNNFDFEEFNNYYFTKKIYKAIESFAKKIKLKYEIFIDDDKIKTEE